MGIAERKQKEKESLRREIIAAATEIFIRDGYDGFSMRKVADAIEYSPTTIYLYFEDKGHLLREVCEDAFRQLGDAVHKARSSAADPIDGLRKGLIAYIEFGLSNPHHYEVAFVTPKAAELGQEAYPFEGSMGERAFGMLAESVAECMEAGTIRRGDVATVAQTFWAGIHGVTSLLIMHEGFPFVDRAKLMASVVETMIAGLRT